ncbi:hypothetical protein QBC36DRAFT_196530, partial [Triangularia setosa]
TSPNLRLAPDVKNVDTLAEGALVTTILLQLEGGVVELDADSAVLAGSSCEVLGVGESVIFGEASHNRSGEGEGRRIDLSCWGPNCDGGYDIATTHKPGHAGIQVDTANEGGNGVDGARSLWVRDADVEGAGNLPDAGRARKTGSEAVKCNDDSLVVVAKDGVDRGWGTPKAGRKDFTGELDTLSQHGGRE